MGVLGVYLRIYGKCMRDTFLVIARNPWTLFLPILVLLVRDWSLRLAPSVGFLGGLLVTLVTAALFSCYLYFLRDLVRGGRVTFSAAELRASLGAYLWAVVNVFFVLWIASFALQLVVGASPNGTAVVLALWIVASVAFNAVPEVIYLRGTHGGMETIAGSWDFLKQQWIPWFAANLPLLLFLGLVSLSAQTLPFVGEIVAGALLHIVSVFRGYLFIALDGSSHRRRMFQQRMG
jgi:hypothetical protein